MGSAAPIVAIVGATGTGKTALALALARRLAERGRRAEIVNADAMQLYRGMDIGTAKVGASERAGVPHHLLDVLDVTEEASVAWYQPRARSVVDEIAGRGAVPLLVGGSGLYVSSVLYDFAFPPRNPRVRARLEQELSRVGAEALHARLRRAEPATAERVSPNNTRRVVRALELVELGASGRVGSLPEAPTPWRPAVVVGLHVPREPLVDRLDARVESMFDRGLLDEVAGLLEVGLADGPTASRAIGYAQAIAVVRGTMARADAVAETQRLTRRYARRQRSWFARYPGIRWLDGTDGPPLEELCAALPTV